MSKRTREAAELDRGQEYTHAEQEAARRESIRSGYEKLAQECAKGFDAVSYVAASFHEDFNVDVESKRLVSDFDRSKESIGNPCGSKEPIENPSTSTK